MAAVALAGIGYLMWLLARRGEFGTSVIGVVAGATYMVALVAFVLAGAMIVSRQPRNVIGWLLIVPGLTVPPSEISFDWLIHLDPAPTAADPLLWLTLWFTGWAWVLLIFPVFHLLLTFPGGRLISPGWRWLAGLEGLMVAAMLFLVGFSEELELFQYESTLWSVPNPIGFVPSTVFQGAFEVVWAAGLLVLTLSSVSAVVLRFWRGSPEQRQQIKWLLVAVGLFGAVYGAGSISSGLIEGGVMDLLFGLSLAGIPTAVAVAVLRYRLYEIDRILSRSVAYVLVVGVLLGVYFGIVGLLTTLISFQGDLVTAGATLTVAALFNPLRRRVRDAVDRRFNRARYDSSRVLDDFAATLRTRIDPEEVVGAWIDVVTTTIEPSRVSMWLRKDTSKAR